MPTTRVYLIRHGETVSSAEDRFAGATDVPLSVEGRAQVEALSRRLAGEPVHRVYASPMQRTLATARAIAAPHGLAPLLEADLREIDHGHWEGCTRAEVSERYPAEAADWESDPFTFAPQGGESGAAVMARASPALRRIVQADLGATIVVVSHKATIRLMLCALLGIDARGYRERLDQSPASLNTLDFHDLVHARLVGFNDISHYAACPAPTGARLSRVWRG